MSFKKMAAHYELTKVAKAFSDLLNKVAVTGGEVTQKEVVTPQTAVAHINKVAKEYNAGAAGREVGQKVANIQWRTVATVDNLTERTLQVDAHLDVMAANPRGFITYLQNKTQPNGQVPLDNIRMLLAADFRLPKDSVRVYVNDMLLRGRLDQGQLENEMRKRVQRDTGTDPGAVPHKPYWKGVQQTPEQAEGRQPATASAARQYLEKMASKKKSIDKTAQGVSQEGSAPQQLDWAYIRALMKNDPETYRTVQQIKKWLNSPNYILTQKADYHLRQMLQGNPMARETPTTPTPAASTGRATGIETKKETTEATPEATPVYSYEGGKDYMKDRRVELAQRRLKALGYYWGKIDGAFGPITRAAIKKFQNRSNIPATGVLDGKTYNALMTGKPPRNTAATNTGNQISQNEAEF